MSKRILTNYQFKKTIIKLFHKRNIPITKLIKEKRDIKVYIEKKKLNNN